MEAELAALTRLLAGLTPDERSALLKVAEALKPAK
jgi:hypothetical protein